MENEQIEYHVRFILTSEFISEIPSQRRSEIIKSLKKIHTTSKYYPWQHNIILDKSFKEIIKKKEIEGFALLGAVHPVPFWDEEGIETSIIKYAINLASKKPFKILILISTAEQQKFERNDHYDNEKIRSSISLLNSQDAYDAINALL